MKETLEEVAERLYPIYDRFKYDEDWVEDVTKRREDFIKGAKWQQERSYSEEDLKEAFKFYAERVICDIKYLDDDFTEFIKQFKKK